MTLNQEFRIVFQPKPTSEFSHKRRFAVGAYSLWKYIGQDNANKAISRALKSEQDKCTIKLRKHGRIDFYFK